MAIKKFKTSNNTNKKAEMLVKICFNVSLSRVELEVLAVIVDFSTNNSLAITLDIAKQIKNLLGISDSSFSTALFRLQEKGVIGKTGKTVTLHPSFNNIHTTEGILISFAD